MMPLHRAIEIQKLDGEGLVLPIHQPAPSEAVSRRLQQFHRLQAQGPVLTRAIGDRRHPWRAEHRFRQPGAEGFQKLHFRRGGFSPRHHVRILEEGGCARIGVIHQVLAGPLEIEQQVDRLAHAAVIELRAAGVEKPALHAGKGIVGQGCQFHAALAHGGEIILGGPFAGGELFAKQIGAGLEALEAGDPVAEILIAHGAEIVAPLHGGQVLPDSPPHAHIRCNAPARTAPPCRGRSRAAVPARSG